MQIAVLSRHGIPCLPYLLRGQCTERRLIRCPRSLPDLCPEALCLLLRIRSGKLRDAACTGHHNCPRDNSLELICVEQVVNAHRPCGLSHQCNSSGIAAERRYIFLHPPDRRHLVMQPVIFRPVKREDIQPVADRNIDDSPLCVLPAIPVGHLADGSRLMPSAVDKNKHRTVFSPQRLLDVQLQRVLLIAEAAALAELLIVKIPLILRLIPEGVVLRAVCLLRCRVINALPVRNRHRILEPLRRRIAYPVEKNVICALCSPDFSALCV